MRSFKTYAKYLVFLVLISMVTSGCMMGYTTKTAYFQFEMLNSRQPIEKVLVQNLLPEEQASRLAMVPKIKAFGENLGLSPTKNYGTYTVNWNRTLLNFSACKPLSFQNEIWRFPIVGKAPYLWFFRMKDAKPWMEKYKSKGWDVWLRSARAYSTSGWFRDPITPAILNSDEWNLAELIAHELAHSTIWKRGYADFNETFASIVGEKIADHWIVARFGADSAEIRRAREHREDQRIFVNIINGLYDELDTVYRDKQLTDEQKLKLKNQLIGSLENRVLNSDLLDKTGYTDYIRREPWNNARLAQYRIYNCSREMFEVLLVKHNGNIRSFIKKLKTITKDADNPWDALKKAIE